MHEPLITLVGNVASAPQLRALPDGTAVAAFRVGNTPRRRDKATQEWSDLETRWFGVSCWRALAENCAQTLGKGDRVVVTGRLTTRSWDGRDGERRTTLEVEATSVGLDLSRIAASRERAETPAQGDVDGPVAEGSTEATSAAA
ncbi:MAG TPA: single-stranded DNA-binding protein [Mycobacteriales bacterium]|nr:single-stranded DNA-binding protein [Mycobacteriales bacterium]